MRKNGSETRLINRFNKSIKCKVINILMALFLITMTFFLPGFAMGHTDNDDSGIFRNYNSDNSMETSIAYDYSDDTIRKVFFIGPNEWDKGDRVHLWIYGMCFGDKQESEYPTHRIRVVSQFQSVTVKEFYCYKRFDYDNFHWQMFDFDKSLLNPYPPGHWFKVYIEDIDHWTYNNLKIGIDKTYGSSPEGDPVGTLIKDFDQSFWYSGGAHVTPDGENEIFGELMIKMEIVDRRIQKKTIPLDFDLPYWGCYPYSFLPIDDNRDWIQWRCFDITQQDIDNSIYARLYIYGYSWQSESTPTQNQFWVQINPGNRYMYDPDTYWSKTQPIGHWYYIDFEPEGNLKVGENVFLLHEDGNDFQRHNLAVVYFDNIDSDMTAWYYDAGHGAVGDAQLRYSQCQGEAGIFLLLYQKQESVKRVGGFSMWCEDHDNGECPYTDPTYNPPFQPIMHSHLPVGTGDIIANRLENEGWQDDHLRLTDIDVGPDLFEGYFYSEGYNGKICGDQVDLLIIQAHGARYGGIKLPEYDWDWLINRKATSDNGLDDDKDIYWTKEGYDQPYNPYPTLPVIYGKPETDNYKSGSFSEYSEDGFNYQNDWILLLVCEALHGWSGLTAGALDKDSPFLTMLYHGTHIMMGYGTNHGGTPTKLQNFGNFLVDNWCDDNAFIIEGFTDANLELPVKNSYKDDQGQTHWYPQNRYVIYYHSLNRYDRLYDEGWVSDDYDFIMGFEDRYIWCMVDPRGVVLDP